MSVNEYSEPLVRPGTVIGLFVPVAFIPVGAPLDKALTVYPVMAEAPVGISKNIFASALPALTYLMTGALIAEEVCGADATTAGVTCVTTGLVGTTATTGGGINGALAGAAMLAVGTATVGAGCGVAG